MQNIQTSSFDQPSQPFIGVRFVLFGFDPIHKSQVSRKLVDNGGVDAGQYGPNCTHVIVDKLTYDDRVCVMARRDGKKLVSSLWVEHSFDVGAPVKTMEIMYKPVKDLNGIPGAKSLVICLTGYQGVDREDIMMMVSLMGAQFSKPLIANKITHLICYKFEGEKYLLAKKINTIKLVNHKWLEDCLKAWEVVFEDDYSKSGYELELEAEAQDSEEKQEGVNGVDYAEDTVQVTTKTNPVPFSNSHEIRSNTKSVIGVTCEPSNSYEGITKSSAAVNRNIHASAVNKSPLNETKKVVNSSCDKDEPIRTTPPTMHTTTSNNSSANRLNKLNFVDAFNASSSLVEKINEEQKCSSSRKRKSSHLQSAFEVLKNGPPVEAATSPGKLLPSNVTACNTSSSRGKNVNLPISKTPTSKIVRGEGLVAVQRSLKEYAKTSLVTNIDNRDLGMENNVMLGLEKSSSAAGTDLSKSSTDVGSNLKPVRRKSYGKKISAPNQNFDKTETVNQKGYIHMKRSEPRIDATTSMADIVGPTDNEDRFTYKKYEKPTRVAKSGLEKEMEVNDGLQVENMFGNKHSDLKNTVDIVMEGNAEGDAHDVDQNIDKVYEIKHCGNLNTFKSKVSVDKSVDTHILVSDEASSGKKKGMKRTSLSVNRATAKTATKKKELAIERPEIRVDATPNRVGKTKKHVNDGEPEDTDDIVMEERTEQDQAVADQENNIVDEMIECRNVIPVTNKVPIEVIDVFENHASNKTSRGKKTGKKGTAVSVKGVTDKTTAKKKEVAMNNVNDLENSMAMKGSDDACNDPEQKNKEVDSEKKGTKKSKHLPSKPKKDATLSVKEVTVKTKKNSSHDTNEKAEVREEVAAKTTKNDNRIENSLEVITVSGVCSDLVQKDDIENVVNTKATKTNKRLSKTKTNNVVTNGNPTSSGCSLEAQKENIDIPVDRSTGNKQVIEKITPKAGKLNSDRVKVEPMWFILAGNKLQRREFQQIIRRLKGRVCKVSHQWSYQATHFIVPDPIRRTEKFFAAAASGRWIMKTDYLSASNQAGKFLPEEAYEWHKNCLSEDGQINLEAPRKWRLLKEKTGHGAFYGMRIVIYGECIAPPLDTLKRVVKAGEGTILATSPPYTRFLNTGIDFAIVSPGMPHVDVWVQEFLRHEIPCVSADYLVEYVCKSGYSLDKHIQYNTNAWAERSFKNLQNRLNEEATEPRSPDSDDVECEVCGSRDRGEEMLICGDESGSIGCGVGTHFDCCDPPLDNIPEEDWFCPKCIKTTKKSSKRKGK
ncbi:BRCT domain-containing protein At4g02110-like [Rutidosis leptorrhynchoides]|uniref:BRCT domain-containing protein At4g02110-like n=1 Tax=Rutidosis leptorrhynchoides TaxID=125765 RepID=UPI003A98D444